jgi:hypothetical protein
MRASIFPALDENRVWNIKDEAKTKGYSSMPRTIPLIGAMADLMAGKGKPVTSTYLELWCRADEQGFVIANKHGEISFASGFSGERGVSTWKQRIRKLEALGFISIKAGTAGDIHYVQIWNPYLVIKDHNEANTEGFSEKHYHAFLERYYEIGALDLEDAVEEPAIVVTKTAAAPAVDFVALLAAQTKAQIPAATLPVMPTAAVPAPTMPAPPMPEMKKTDT